MSTCMLLCIIIQICVRWNDGIRLGRTARLNGESKHDIKEKIRQRYKGGDAENMHMIPARPKESLFEENTEKKVCAYCRVSTDDPRQTSSYELQKNHYEEFIREHPGWVLVDIYADEGITGTIHSKFHACQLCVHSADLSLYHLPSKGGVISSILTAQKTCI